MMGSSYNVTDLRCLVISWKCMEIAMRCTMIGWMLGGKLEVHDDWLDT